MIATSYTSCGYGASSFIECASSHGARHRFRGFYRDPTTFVPKSSEEHVGDDATAP